MFELLKSLVFAVVVFPVVMAIILGLMYGLGEVVNIFSRIGHNDRTRSEQHRRFLKTPGYPGVLRSVPTRLRISLLVL